VTLPRFGFLVHPLVSWHRRVVGVRRLHLAMAMGGSAGIEAVGQVAALRFRTGLGQVDGVIVGVPHLAEALVADQQLALTLQVRAAHEAIALGAEVIGLGSALAVVAGRGMALAERMSIPVTTGNAATAWATATTAQRVLADRPGPVGVLGFKGTVGDAVALRLAAAGHEVWAEATGRARRRAEAIGCRPAPVDEVLARCPVLVGATTTGPVLDPAQVPPQRVLIDLALPPTLGPGPRPEGLQVVAAEALSVPRRVQRGFWGAIWLGLAGYGRGVVYACLVEPAAMVLTGSKPYGLGRRLDPEAVDEVGRVLDQMGFRAVVRRRG